MTLMPNQEVFVASKISIEFNKILKGATACYIAVGMITDNMFDFSLRQLTTCTDIRIICGVHMATTPQVMIKLKELTAKGKIESGVYLKSFFHAKLYLFRLDESWIAFVGSGNFTKGGWQENEELFVRITSEITCASLLSKFNKWMNDCEPISKEFIELYEQNYFANNNLELEKKKATANFLDKLKYKFNLDNVDLTGQFFEKDDILAFQPGKTHLDTKEVLDERRIVRNKLYQLNGLIMSKLPTEWKLEPHYQTDNIVSHIETKNHHDFNVRSLWVGYGRNKAMLKKYDKYSDSDNTPLYFMRMQAILSYDKFGVWLMPGKNNAGEIDREYFQTKMKEDDYCRKIFNLIKGLGEPYWIEVADDLRQIAQFTEVKEFKEYIEKDNWRYFYFIIGRDYSLDDKAISRDNIAQTCVNNFKKYQPIYEMFKDKSFDRS